MPKFIFPEKKGIDFGIKIKNFGPVSHGKVDIKLLTIMIGPNSSGKSYTAMLINSFLNAISERYTPRIVLPRDVYPDLNDVYKELTNEYIDDLEKKLVALKEGKSFPIGKGKLQEVAAEIFVERLSDEWGREIKKVFSSSLVELPGKADKNFEVEIIQNGDNIAIAQKSEKISLTKHRIKKKKINIQSLENSPVPVEVVSGDDTLLINLETPVSVDIYDLVTDIVHYYIRDLTNKYYWPVFNLPASRSHLMHIYKDFSSIKIKSPDEAKTTGVVSAFLSDLLRFEDYEGDFYELATTMEKEMIEGEIFFDESSYLPYPEVRYKSGDIELPLYRTSSTISEIAPLILYLKHIIEPGSVFIIEEPEAHLHPGNQRILAKYLVRLIRAGVNLIITTHSDYLLEQLNSFIMLSGLDARKRTRKRPYDEEDYLLPDEVRVCLFKRQPKLKAYKIEEVEVTAEDGISMEEFVRVLEVLNEEAAGIKTDLNQKK